MARGKSQKQCAWRRAACAVAGRALGILTATAPALFPPPTVKCCCIAALPAMGRSAVSTVTRTLPARAAGAEGPMPDHNCRELPRPCAAVGACAHDLEVHMIACYLFAAWVSGRALTMRTPAITSRSTTALGFVGRSH